MTTLSASLSRALKKVCAAAATVLFYAGLGASLQGCITATPPPPPAPPAPCVPTASTTYRGGDTFGEELTVTVDPSTLSTTTTTTYAWVSFETTDVTSQGSLAGVITGYGYDNTGGDITAGQTVATPEPGSLALLAMGGAGLLAYRRRRAAR